MVEVSVVKSRLRNIKKTTKSATNPRPEVSRVLGIDPTSCFYKCLMFEGAERVEGGAELPQAGVQGGGAEGNCQQEQGAPAGHPHQDLQGLGGHPQVWDMDCVLRGNAINSRAVHFKVSCMSSSLSVTGSCRPWWDHS